MTEKPHDPDPRAEPASEARANADSSRTSRPDDAERGLDPVRRSEETHRFLFESLPVSVIIFDAATLRILAVNERAVQHYGYTRDEFVKLTMKDLKPQEDLHELVETMRSTEDARTMGIWRGTRRHLKKDGSPFDAEIMSHGIVLEGRRAVLTIERDATETQRMEEQLRQSQKMEAIGQLAGGVAHDFNNLLSVVMFNAEMAAADLGEGHANLAELAQIKAAAERGGHLTRKLLAFSRQQPREPRVMSLRGLIAGMEKLLAPLLGENVRLVTRLAEHGGTVEADPGHMEQVVINLVLNARDAMPDGGVLTIETYDVDLDAASARMLGATRGRHVVLSVSDTGCGMSAAVRERIFEPFFTTKEIGKGTGLGLPTVFGIVQQSRGCTQVDSAPGRGTVFRVYLPSVEPPGEAARPPRPDPAKRAGWTVLVVEDEEPVRLSVARLLRRAGHQVLEAGRPTVALSIWREQHGEIDVVLTDIAMPELDGVTLAERLRETRPGVPVVFMSGYAAQRASRLRPDEAFLPKPFAFADLLRTIERAIARSTATHPAA